MVAPFPQPVAVAIAQLLLRFGVVGKVIREAYSIGLIYRYTYYIIPLRCEARKLLEYSLVVLRGACYYLFLVLMLLSQRDSLPPLHASMAKLMFISSLCFENPGDAKIYFHSSNELAELQTGYASGEFIQLTALHTGNDLVKLRDVHRKGE